MVYETEVKEGVLRMNALGGVFGASIEDADVVMARVIDRLVTDRNVLTVLISEARDHEYDEQQTKLLVGIADAISEIVREKRLVSMQNLGDPAKCGSWQTEWYNWLSTMATFQLRGDPIGAYLNLVREIRRLEVLQKKGTEQDRDCIQYYMEHALFPIRAILEKTELIRKAQPFLTGYHIGDRGVYRRLFHSMTRPSFMLTKFSTKPPPGEVVKRYQSGSMTVEIFKVPGKIRPIYFVTPPEFRLTEDEYTLLDDARRTLEQRRPVELEMKEQTKMRELFFNISRELLRDLADVRGFKLAPEDVEKLATILTRYTAGLGIIELLLADENIEDVNINSPMGTAPIYIRHREFEECETNLIPTPMDGERLATRFKLLSGRPLDEANPVLDTEIAVPGGVARVAAIGPRLSPEGLAFALRRHRFRPWTFPLFINERMFSPLFAGLMWFVASYGRTLLIAGTRGAGKTSVLGSLALQTLPFYRMITVEDSVTGDAEMMIEREGKLERTTVGELIDGQLAKHGATVGSSGHELLDRNPERIRVFSMDSRGKISLVPVNNFIRHRTDKPILEVRTRTGRRLRVTADHSLFTLGPEGAIASVPTRELKVGSYIAVPRALPSCGMETAHIDLTEHLERLRGLYLQGPQIKVIIEKHWDTVKEAAVAQQYSSSMPSAWKQRGLLPASICAALKSNGAAIPKGCRIKALRQSRALPARLPLDTDMLAFFGLWLADGCYDSRSVIVSATDPATRALVRRVAGKLGLPVKRHSDGWSLMVNSVVLKHIMQSLELTGDAYTKRIPGWVFGLSGPQKAALLRGLFSGDGHVSRTELIMALVSEKMVSDVQTLLLEFGVVAKVSKLNPRDRTYRCTVGAVKWLSPFAEKVGFLQPGKNRAMRALCNRQSSHDTLDVIPLPTGLKCELGGLLNKGDYVTRGYQVGREKLRAVVGGLRADGGGELAARLSALADSDLFWDEVAEIKPGPAAGRVYDLSVFGNESFVCQNIVAHNTFELPIEALRTLGFNVERMKSRSVITHVELELPAEEAIRTALRLGDSTLIIGEVRSIEAKALYEAMRIGALANLVAGTIHGESAYGVFDRVVNDLGVPATSFKATDLVVIANRLRTADGLKSYRRVTSLTEVRKNWMRDPAEEKGFVDLLEFDSKADSLRPTDTLLNGESFVLNEIAKRVPGWAGRWDAVWDNIQLRSKILETIVQIANQTGRKELMEAETTVASNQKFHELAERSRIELGSVDSKTVYDGWLAWFKEQAKTA